MADTQVLAPRLKKISEIEGKALMVHAGGITTPINPNRWVVVAIVSPVA